MQRFFGGIGVLKTSGKFVYFDINSVSDLKVLFAHFALYPLVGSKRNMYYIFTMVHQLYVGKVHLKPQGFLQCVAYINCLNNSIKLEVLEAIQSAHGALPPISLAPVLVPTSYSLNPYWILGFVCGEGSFIYFTRTRLTASGVIKLDYTLVFETSQLPLDTVLLNAVLEHIGFGNLFSRIGAVSRIRIVNVDILQHYVLPFFTLYPMPGYKGIQYRAWLSAVEYVLSHRVYSEAREIKLTALLKGLSAL
jgi:hypothetical protein